jgi:hypothetical protein
MSRFALHDHSLRRSHNVLTRNRMLDVTVALMNAK